VKAQKENENLSLVQKTYEKVFSKFGLDFHVVLVDKAPDKYEWKDDWSFSGFEAYIESGSCKAKVQIKYTPRYGVGYYLVDNGLKPILPWRTAKDVQESDEDLLEMPIKDTTAQEIYSIELKTVEGKLVKSKNREHSEEVLSDQRLIELEKSYNINHEPIWVTKDEHDGALLSLIDIAHIFLEPINRCACSEYEMKFAIYPEYVEKLGEAFKFSDAYKLTKSKLEKEINKAEKRVQMQIRENHMSASKKEVDIND
jgi:hypothetical protein